MDSLAKDIMTSELITFTAGHCLEEAIKLLMNSKITGLPVVDEQNNLVGVLSEFDIIAQLSKVSKLTTEVFKEPAAYSSKVESISEQTPLSAIIDLFVSAKFRRLPVVSKEGKLVGIITQRDLIRLFYYRARLT